MHYQGNRMQQRHRAHPDASLLDMLPPRFGPCSVLLLILALTDIPASARENAVPSSPKRIANWIILAKPIQLVNGAPIFLQVTPPVRLSALTATWLGHDIAFAQSGKTWVALAGVSLETSAGKYPLLLNGTTVSGGNIFDRRSFTIARGKYPIVQLTVSKQFTEPTPQQQQTIKDDQEIKHKTFAETSTERQWSGPFTAPVDAAVSDVFGTRRVFNGATKSLHQGLDYRVPSGTPVHALNRGTVLLAQALYFEGNCVMIDHGQGLLSLYLHLSQIDVKEGDHIERGQQIGLSGATGRATGPHLHIAVRWQGVYLNPAALLALPLPEITTQSATR